MRVAVPPKVTTIMYACDMHFDFICVGEHEDVIRPMRRFNNMGVRILKTDGNLPAIIINGKAVTVPLSSCR